MTSDNRKVVILLATLDGADYLPAQLQSYRDQSYSNWELVVSDDGSSDSTIEIVQAFAKLVPQRVTILQGPRAGFWRNFLSLVHRADSEASYFAYSDQDDIWHPEKLERAIAWLKTIPENVPAVYFTRTALIGKDDKKLGFSPLFEREPTFQNALVQSIGGGNTTVFNRAAKQALAQTPPSLSLVSHDWWAYQLVTGSGGVARYDPWPSVRYRQHDRNMVGANAGLLPRVHRIGSVAKGRFAGWNDINIDALQAMRHLLSPSNLATLDRFSLARKSSIPKRLYLLWKSGVHRQSALENFGLYTSALFGRI